MKEDSWEMCSDILCIKKSNETRTCTLKKGTYAASLQETKLSLD